MFVLLYATHPILGGGELFNAIASHELDIRLRCLEKSPKQSVFGRFHHFWLKRRTLARQHLDLLGVETYLNFHLKIDALSLACCAGKLVKFGH